ncbi:hypothetical protein OCH239_02695 [Roseivivax halodurans JCM 10272]|uniref:Uncharacterized protein n=1 Tax=Roseivivax halodurans JCM 10272 TaxID=1449350 RepID=X7EFC6_9RHOB|nr:hypothetical protein [Roseivivax halodurans]ETX14575.1 hypothetical protein OCH239_02695 [Roseivivax halodurans JCM 10272]
MRLIPIVFLALLAACATPLERCVSQARASLTAAESELRELEQILARGYAIEYRTRSYPVFVTCVDGDGDPYPCVRERTQRVPKRVPVNLVRVAQRADEIRARLPALQTSADTGAAQCRNVYADSLAEQR